MLRMSSLSLRQQSSYAHACWDWQTSHCQIRLVKQFVSVVTLRLLTADLQSVKSLL